MAYRMVKWDRAPIGADGIYSDIPLETYHGDLCVDPSISSSGLRTITEHSPAHYWCRSPYNPDRVEETEEPHYALGRAAHHLLLGEEAFSTTFICRPDKWDSWRTDASKAWRDEQREEGRTVLIPKDLDIIRAAAKSLSKHALVEAGILNGEVERSIICRDPETGLWIKTRPDVIPNDSGDFCDLKTTTDVTFDELSRTIGVYGYHQQAALVGEAYKRVTGRPMTSFTFCFFEKEPPWSVRFVTLKECDLDRGARQNRNALRLAADCFDKNEWPGPGDSNEAEFIEIPVWLQGRIDRELEFQDKVWKSKKEKKSQTDYLGAG
jgi:hypothetical protein